MNNEEKILTMLVELKESTDKQFEAIDKQFEAIDKRFDTMDKQFEAIGGRLDTMDKQFETIDERLDTMDEQFEGFHKQFVTMEERLDCLDTRSQRTAVLLEAEVDRKLDLLYEGHEAIMEYLDKLAPKDRVDALESDVIVLKNAVKMLTQEIAELKKAQ